MQVEAEGYSCYGFTAERTEVARSFAIFHTTCSASLSSLKESGVARQTEKKEKEFPVQ